MIIVMFSNVLPKDCVATVQQVAQLSQRDLAVGWVNYGRLELGDNILRTIQVYV